MHNEGLNQTAVFCDPQPRHDNTLVKTSSYTNIFFWKEEQEVISFLLYIHFQTRRQPSNITTMLMHMNIFYYSYRMFTQGGSVA